MSKINGPQISPPDRSERHRPEPTEVKADLESFREPVLRLVNEKVGEHSSTLVGKLEVDYLEQSTRVFTDGSFDLSFDIIHPEPRMLQGAKCTANNDSHTVSNLKLIGELFLPPETLDAMVTELSNQAAAKLSSQRETPKPID